MIPVSYKMYTEVPYERVLPIQKAVADVSEVYKIHSKYMTSLDDLYILTHVTLKWLASCRSSSCCLIVKMLCLMLIVECIC